jgi:hypothetical protein
VNKRIRKKIINRFLDLDDFLTEARLRDDIVALARGRAAIQRLARRYPRLYLETFYAGRLPLRLLFMKFPIDSCRRFAKVSYKLVGLN